MRHRTKILSTFKFLFALVMLYLFDLGAWGSGAEAQVKNRGSTLKIAPVSTEEGQTSSADLTLPLS